MIKKIIIGILAGVICGLFGTGGGMILVPSFIYILNVEPKKARATSICCMLCAIGGIVGGYLGAKILKKVPDYILKIAFTCFLIYVSYNMIF